MNIAVGSDHAGHRLKKEVVRFLSKENLRFRDFGGFSDEPTDYPDVGFQVAEAVASGEFEQGILVCGTGIGMSITANKVPGIRAALCCDTYCARVAREHNDANILVLGGRVTDVPTALDIVRTWLAAHFSDEQRHVRRIQRITDGEGKYGGGGH